MKTSVRQLDRILRGEATRLPDLEGGRIEVSPGGLVLLLVGLGMFYGACMGIFSLTKAGSGHAMQVLASAVKVPALFLLTLLVTLPSLYVFNALVGSRLSPSSLVRLLIAAIGVMMAVLASMGTIVAFFSLSSESYPFMVLLNVVIFAVSGFLGLAFLLQTLHRLSVALAPPAPPPPLPAATTTTTTSEAGPGGNGGGGGEASAAQVRIPGALDAMEGQVLGPHVRTVFRIWVIVFGLVGAQMAWVLRPFVGDPNLEFSWFRRVESSFFEDVLRKIGQLFS